MQPVYLDYNATAPLRPEARSAVIEALSHVGNPSSVHQFGRAARKTVEDARGQVASLVGVTPSQIIFTSGATEANNMVLGRSQPVRVLVSAIEHESVLAAEAARVPVTGDGVLDLEALERLLAADSRPALISVMLANNEIGTIQPITEVALLARRFGALVHCDAVQAVGKMPVAFDALDVDFMSVSSHKIGGPQGVGALIVRESRPVPVMMKGGGQEKRRRAGTENVAGIAGFGAAAIAASRGLGDYQRVERLRDALESRLRAAFPALPTFGRNVARLPNTSCVAMPRVPAETQIMSFDLAGIAVSSGSACSSGKVAASHVLTAMGVDKAIAGSAIRISLGWGTGEGEIERFVEAWINLHQRAGRRTIVAA